MLNPTKDERARSQLSRQLQSRLTTIQYTNPKSVLNLFQAFDLTGFRYKGQLSSGYGERGTEVSLDVSWDFGDLILPGLLSAKLEGGASGRKTHYTLVVVTRHPSKLLLHRWNKKAQWTTAQPLSLISLSGYAAEVKAHLGVSASVGYTTGVDELGLEVAAEDEDEKGMKASAEVKADVSGRIMRLQDLNPRFYPSASDNSLALNFMMEMDLMTRHQIKNMIQAWLKTKMPEKDWSRVRAFLEEQAESQIEEAKERKESAIESAKDKTGLDYLEEKWDSLGVETKAPGLFTRLVRAARPPKTHDLIASLAQLEKELPEDDEDETKKLAYQIRRFREQLENLQKAKTLSLLEKKKEKKKEFPQPSPQLSGSLAHLCFLNLFVTDAGGSAEASGKASFKLTNPFKKSHEVSGHVAAQASAAGRAHMVAYRFQALASDTNPLIVTQDTVLSYRSVDLGAAASGSLDLDLPEGYTTEDDSEHKGEKEYSLVYRTMTYRSATIYWLYPTSPAAKTMPALGSGISFGAGVQVSRLLKLAQELVDVQNRKKSALSDKSKRLLQRLARQLHLPEAQVEQFLRQANIHEDAPANYLADTLLLESGFTLPGLMRVEDANKSFILPLEKKKDIYQLPDILKNVAVSSLIKQLESSSPGQETGGLSLSCIRLRYRISDNRDRSGTLFKLGFSYVVGLDFHIDRVKTSGHEGIVDLYIWFADDELNAKPLLGQELAVPPVAMLHQ